MSKPTAKEIDALLHAIDVVRCAGDGADDFKKYRNTQKRLESLFKKIAPKT